MIIKQLYKYLLIFLVALFMQTSIYANCSKSYTLGFFNGVWNTYDQANVGRDKLKLLIGEKYNNEPVKYEAFYNHTGKSVGATALQDLAETFIQRSAEIDASGELGKRFEYFWEFIGSSKPTFIDKIKGIVPKLNALFDSLYTAIVTNLVGAISYMNSNPPTEADYASHNAKLDTLAANGEKLMLVAHSQGNLFVNHAYDHILPVVTKNRVAVAHIAPASPTLRGDYLLADIDIVINAMRLQGLSSVPAGNLPLPFSKADASGHTLIGTYLDETREGRGKVKTMIKGEMDTLSCFVLEYAFIRMSQTFPYGNGMALIRSSWCHDHLNVTTPSYPLVFSPFPIHLFPDFNAPLPNDFFNGAIPSYLYYYPFPSTWSTSCSLNMLLDYFRYTYNVTTSKNISPIDGSLYIDGHPYNLILRLTDL